MDDEGDDLRQDDVRRLNEALERAHAQVERGETTSAREVVERLRSRR